MGPHKQLSDYPGFTRHNRITVRCADMGKKPGSDQLIFFAKLTRPGQAITHGVDLTYRAGGKTYTTVDPFLFGLCSTKCHGWINKPLPEGVG